MVLKSPLRYSKHHFFSHSLARNLVTWSHFFLEGGWKIRKWKAVLVHSRCSNEIPQTTMVDDKPQKFTSHNSGSWEV